MKSENLLIKFIAWTLQAQLLITPNFAFAQKEKKEKKVKEKKSKDDKNKFDFNKALGTANKALDSFGQVAGSNGLFNGGGANPFQQGGMFTPQATMTDDYFGKCKLLQETTNKATEAICNIGNKAQYDQYQAYKTLALDNAHEYEIYLKEGVIQNVNGMATFDNNEGLKCIKTETEALQKFLQSRLDEIDDFINSIDKEKEIMANTLERGYLKPLRDMQARLYGNQGNMQFDESQFDNFFSTPACASLSATDFEKIGGQGGLNGVRTNLNTQFESTESGGTNKYSPKRYLQASGEISNAVSSSAKRIAADIQNKIDTGSSLDIESIKNIKNSGFQVSSMGSLTEAVSDQVKVYNDLTNDIDSLEVDAVLKQNAKDPNVNFDQKIQQYESRIYSQCLSEAFQKQGMPLDTFLDSIKTANSLKGSRVQYQIDLQNLVNQLRSEDISYDNFVERFDQLKAGRTYVVGNQGNASRISASLPMRNALTFCENQFARVDEDKGQKYSTKQSIAILKEKHAAIKSKATSLANDVQNSIIDRVLNCSGIESVGTAANSCSSDSFNSESSNFCLKGATRCAANMNQCLNQAKSEIAKVERARADLINGSAANGRPGLKQVVANQQRSVEMRYQSLEAKVRAMSDDLKRRLPGINAFPVPAVFTHTEENRKFLLEQDGAFDQIPENLRVEDPMAYMDRLKEHLTGENGLKASIIAQRESIFSGDRNQSGPFEYGLTAYVANIKAAYEKEANAWKAEATKCDALASKFMEDRKKQMDDLNEELVACSYVLTEEIDDNVQYLSEDILKVLEAQGAMGARKIASNVNSSSKDSSSLESSESIKTRLDQLKEDKKVIQGQLNTAHKDDKTIIYSQLEDLRSEIKDLNKDYVEAKNAEKEQSEANDALETLKLSLKGAKTGCEKVYNDMLALKAEMSGQGQGQPQQGINALFN